MRRGIIILALLALAGSAAAQSEPRESARRQPFALGLEYMAPGLAAAYSSTGIKWAKAMGQGFSWGDIEPRPPVRGRHTYDWSYTDRLILEYQRAGFESFHVYVKCRCSWASSKPLSLMGTPSYPPKPEFMDDYAEYVRQLVERYDKDGLSDAPGLLYPVRYWEIEAEWGTFWPGTVEEYLDLLKVAHRAVKSADENAQVVLVGFFIAGVFEANPVPEDPVRVARERLPAQTARNIERGIEEVRALLRHPELFDVVEFHSLSDWTEIIGMSRFLRRLMHENGYEKPIWVGDVNYTASPMMFWGMPVPPYTEKQKAGIEETLRALANPKHPKHASTEAWFRAEQAKGLVKKVVLAMGEGLAGINIGNLEDWGAFALAPTLSGTAAFHGLIETTGFPRRPGEPRPAFHALTLVNRELDGFSAVERLDLGTGIYCYRFTVGTRSVHVLWYDDGKRYLPGEAEPTKRVTLRLPPAEYRIVSTPTARGVADPPVQTASAHGGTLALDVGSVPLFIEPAGAGP